MDDIFFKHISCKREEYFEKLNDAEELTDDYKYRHGLYQYRKGYAKKILGAFRWKGIYQNKELLRNFIDNKKCIDFGGAGCPLSDEVPVVDILKKKYNGSIVEFSSLNQIKYKVDLIFSSHCLEHIEDIESILVDFSKVLSEDGIVFLHLPAYSCKRWRPSSHKNKKFGNHLWSFTLSEDKHKVLESEKNRNIEIDILFGKHFNVKHKSYCGDNSIILIGGKL